MDVLLVKWVHVLSSTLLFGTGIGSAFYLFFVSLTRDTRAVAVVAQHVVVADWIFTASTVVLQPVSGVYLVERLGYPWGARWLQASIALYAFAVACWLPVVWLQYRLRDIALAPTRPARRCRRRTGVISAAGRRSACRRSRRSWRSSG